MREGAPVDPNLSLADMLPPDKADESRILQAAFALVASLARRTPSGRAEVTVTLDAEGWAALEAERRRYLRPHASYVYAPHPEGAGAVRLVRAQGDAVVLYADPPTDAAPRRQCVHANGPCPDPSPHCGFCGRTTYDGGPHAECRATSLGAA